jgi:hypothetical protein
LYFWRAFIIGADGLKKMFSWNWAHSQFWARKAVYNIIIYVQVYVVIWKRKTENKSTKTLKSPKKPKKNNFF